MEPPFSRGVLVLRGDTLAVTRWSLLFSTTLPLLIDVLLVVVTTLLVTRDGVEEKTDAQRSAGTFVSDEIHVLLRGSERQLLNRGRGGFGVLPVKIQL